MKRINKIVFGGPLALALTAVLSSGTLAAKPEGKQGGGGADKRPPASYDKQRARENSFEKSVRMDADGAKSKIREHRNDDDRASGLAKQQDMKAGQEQKELGRGSEQGQEAREENSRKWWKIWE